MGNIIKMKNKRVKCQFCKKDIHIDNWAGVNKKGFICGNITCLMKLAKEMELKDKFRRKEKLK